MRSGIRATTPWLGLTVGGAALVALGSAHWALEQDTSLDASVVVSTDADLDGLSDLQEQTFGTSPYSADTDGDGVSDAVELALGSSPVLATDVPDPNASIGVGMVAHGGNGQTTIEMLLFARDGQFANKHLSLSMLTPQGFVPLSIIRIANNATVSDFDVAGGGLLRSISIAMSPRMVQAPGVVHWVAAMAESGGGTFSAAATCRLEGDLATNSVFWTRSGHTLPPSTSGQAPPAGARINQPIPPFPGENSTTPPGNPGQVCVQLTEVVGTGVGSTIITEVVDANCDTGWAAYCSPGVCAASVGATFEVVNPRNLLGG
ncbi:MAG TPA: thrombospondin type 3 repeat-containing protein [Planctomycetota bacterium]|nr:thrombospondin type 3 repeat-containing protein [Planctomycetota bacterium]